MERRMIKIVYKNGMNKHLDIVKATKINANLGMIHFDKLETGWRLIFTEDIADEFKDIDRFEIIREFI
ncbi:MAG: hypothetical protein ACOC33_01760 [bacterium]